MWRSFLMGSVLWPAVLFAEDPKSAARNLVNWGTLDGVLQDNGLPVGWSTYPSSFDRFDAYTVLDAWHSAPRGLKLTSEMNWSSLIVTSQPLQPGTRQAARAWVKPDRSSKSPVQIRIDYMGADGKMLGSSPSAILPPRPEENLPWTLLAVESDPTPFPAATHFLLAATQYAAGSAVWDDFDARSYVEVIPSNLLLNGDFEIVAGSDFLDWKLLTKQSPGATLHTITKEPQHGWFAVGIVSEAESAVLHSMTRIKIDPRRTYRLSGSARGLAGSVVLKMIFWKGAARLGQKSVVVDARPEWTAAPQIAATSADIGEADKLSVELETTGKTDLAIDALRLWAQ